jgi:hypothetical protein
MNGGAQPHPAPMHGGGHLNGGPNGGPVNGGPNGGHVNGGHVPNGGHVANDGPGHHDGGPGPHGQHGQLGGQCTAPQLRRFIKSRPYVPMHELRRRFGINGNDDDVCPIELEPGLIFVGLPPREGDLLGELLRAGEIGYELSMDPRTPVVVGVYPMRPVPRT